MSDRPILIAYDGSDFAKEAIRQAGDQLADGRRAIVLTVWQPFGTTAFVGGPVVVPAGAEEDIEKDARRVADEGASLARAAGFEAEAEAREGDPVWKQIVDSADEHDADIVVMGSHGRTGMSRVLLGSVAGTVAGHTQRLVLIAHDGAQPAPEQA